MNKYLLLLLILCLLLTSCTVSPISIESETTLSPKQSVTSSIKSEPADSPLPTLFIPLTKEEIKANLEISLDENLKLSDKQIIGDANTIVFDGTKGSYFADSQTGALKMFSSSTTNDNPELLYDKEATRLIAIEVINKFCPDFFDYDYFFDFYENFNNVNVFTFYQLSKKGHRTGNNIRIEIVADGATRSIIIFNNEDPTTVDKSCAINKQEAIELVYMALPGEAQKAFEVDENTVNFDLTDKQSHETSAYLSCFKGQTRWYIEISGVYCKVTTPKGKSIEYLFSFIADIDANSGDVGTVGYGVISTYTDGKWQ